MKQLKEEDSIRFESQIIIHILYLGISNSKALARIKCSLDSDSCFDC